MRAGAAVGTVARRSRRELREAGDRTCFRFALKTTLVTARTRCPAATPGRSPCRAPHAVLGTPLEGPWPEGTQVLYVAMGCFWGAEKAYWQLPGVVTTAVGYQGGYTTNPTYEETCTGRTGHTEAVLVAYDPKRAHDREAAPDVLGAPRPHPGLPPGQRRRHPVPLGGLLDDATSRRPPTASTRRRLPAAPVDKAGFGEITTDGRPAADAGPFYYAEDYHQQYLYKVPNGYCPVHSTGVSCPIGVGVTSTD